MHIRHLIIPTLHLWIVLSLRKFRGPSNDWKLEASTSTCFQYPVAIHYKTPRHRWVWPPWGQQLWYLCIGNHSTFTSCACLAAGASLRVDSGDMVSMSISMNLEAYETPHAHNTRLVWAISYQKSNQWLLVGGLLVWNPCMPWWKLSRHFLVLFMD